MWPHKQQSELRTDLINSGWKGRPKTSLKYIFYQGSIKVFHDESSFNVLFNIYLYIFYEKHP